MRNTTVITRRQIPSRSGASGADSHGYIVNGEPKETKHAKRPWIEPVIADSLFYPPASVGAKVQVEARDG
ncbi:MAG TPA: hypothetical protein VJU15_07960 [Gemmatimonadales bacterium]|nr:hypothetical protein [Gemmatimonadales bacterium]